MWSHFEDQSFFRDVCHTCITEHVATPAQDAFMPGTDCQQVYVIQSGAKWMWMTQWRFHGDLFM